MRLFERRTFERKELLNLLLLFVVAALLTSVVSAQRRSAKAPLETYLVSATTQNECRQETGSSNCPRTIGYWKNHVSHMASILASGSIDLGDRIIRTTDEASAIFQAASAFDARNMLRAQLLATMFNLRNGADPFAAGFDVLTVVSQAQEFLRTHPSPVTSGHPDREEALRLKDSLDAYNNAQCEEGNDVGGGGNGGGDNGGADCPRTIGYWKNHAAHLASILADGPIDLGDRVIRTTDEALAVLRSASAVDARDMLRAQLLSAMLNLRNGTDPFATGFDVRTVVSQAQTFLRTHTNPVTSGHPEREEALRLKDLLDTYNNANCDAGEGGGELECGIVQIIKEVQNTTDSANVAFPFTAVQGTRTTNFTMVDDNAGPGNDTRTIVITSFGSANTLTVTENTTLGWTLGDINCEETGGIDNTTTDFGASRANIIVEPGERVVCTFSNLQLAPSAAPASLHGWVKTSRGSGIAGARIQVMNSVTNEIRSAVTGPFGFYRIEDLEAGEYYLVTVSHRRFRFGESTRLVGLFDSLAELDFVASP